MFLARRNEIVRMHPRLTPILSPATPGERRYNRTFLKARKNIECAFCVWKSRWRAVDKAGGTLCYFPERVCKLAVATMVLHNICIDHGLHWEQWCIAILKSGGTVL